MPGGNKLHKSHPYTFPTITKLSPWWIGRWRWGVVASCRGSRMNWRGALGSGLSPCRSTLAVPSASWELWMWIHCLCQHPRDPPVTKRWRHTSALPTNQCDATWQTNAGPCGKRSYTFSGTQEAMRLIIKKNKGCANQEAEWINTPSRWHKKSVFRLCAEGRRISCGGYLVSKAVTGNWGSVTFKGMGRRRLWNDTRS